MKPDAAMRGLGLKYNPFPPAAMGTAFVEEMWVPESWSEKIHQQIGQLATGGGPKATAIVGPYGSGKTFLLHWMMENEFRKRRIRPYFFDNPGVAFYDLANRLLRQVGRYELSKAMWELFYKTEASSSRQPRLIELSFPEWLTHLGDRNRREQEIRYLAEAMRENEVTDEEEVSFRFAQLVVNTRDRPYYEFRDFVPRSSSSIVPEGEEDRYFRALIRILRRVFEADGIAFLIDEFEDVALGKRLARRQISDYTATLRRLLDTAQEEEFWLALSITPEGMAQTRAYEPALLERFGPTIQIQPLSDGDAHNLVYHRLQQARIDGEREGIWPFAEDAISAITPTNRGVPRRLIKILWLSLALAVQGNSTLPISNSIVERAERLLSDES